MKQHEQTLEESSSVTSSMARIARGGLANLLGAGFSALLNLALVIVVARLYEPTIAGALFASTSAFLIVTTAVECGVDQGFVRFIARHQAHGKAASVGRTLRAGYPPVIALGLLVAAGGVLFAGAGGMLGEAGGQEARKMVWVLALAVPVAAAYDVTLAATRGFSTMKPTVLVERLARPALQLTAITACAAVDGGATALAAAWAAPYTVCLLAAIVSLRSIRASQSTPAVVDPDAASGDDQGRWQFWYFTAPQGVARIAQVALQRADVVLVAALLGAPAAAVYTAATRFVVVGQIAVQAIQQVVQPQLARLLALREDAATETVFRHSTTWFVALTWPFYIACAVTAPLLLHLFGDEYVAGASTLTVLCVAMLAATAVGPVDVLLLMSGRSVLSLINTCLALALDIFLCIVLVPSFEIFGAALAWVAAILLRNTLGLYQVRKYVGVHFGSRPLLNVTVAALVLIGVVPLFARLALSGWAVVIVAIALGTLLYGVALWRWRHHLGLEAFAGIGRWRRHRNTFVSESA